MTPVGGGSFVPLNEEEISKVEEWLGSSLPSEYRVFLATFGECDFDGWASFSTDQLSVSVGWFIGEGLLKVIEGSLDWLPAQMVPIAEDGGGNTICLSLAGSDYGRVYFRYHGDGWSSAGGDIDTAKRSVLVPLAKSFEAFVLGLTLEE